MSFRELVAWAWRATPAVHTNSTNLIIHLFAVSIFVSGHVLLLAAVGVAWWLAVAGFLCIVVSLAESQVAMMGKDWRLVLSAACLLAVSSLARAQSEDRITIRYGSEPTSFGELKLPAGHQGPFPVAVLIHGGCWRSDQGSTVSFRPLADELSADGIATWNIEFRRVGHEGGGWPGTFVDLGKAVDRLSTLSREYPVDLKRIVLVGHSSGGHFAAWLATRKLLPKSSAIRGEPAVGFMGVVVSDAFIDPLVIDSKGVEGKLYCDDPLLERLVGGRPDLRPEPLRQISPLKWLPWGMAQEYVVSSRRYPVMPPRPLADGRTTMTMPDYPALARAAGDTINVTIVEDANHFDFMKPETAAHAALHQAVLRLFKVH